MKTCTDTKRLFTSASLLSIAVVLFSSVFVSFARQRDTTNREYSWKLVPSPVQTHLTNIALFSPRKGYIAGTSLLELDRQTWVLSRKQPPVHINQFFALDSNAIWVTSYNSYYESELFRFNGRWWEGISHPLANNITTMVFARNGTGWVAGIGEIARLESKQWRFLPPPTRGSFSSLQESADSSVWLIAQGGALYHFKNNTWTRHLHHEQVKALRFNSPSRGYALGQTSLYQFRDSLWTLHSQDSLLQRVTRFAVLPEGPVWAIGDQGLILQYTGTHWQAVGSPTSEPLNDIAMLSETEGWAVGNNGTILHFSADRSLRHRNLRYGFTATPIPSTAKVVDDEYGVAMGDINGDGFLDIYAVGIFEPNRLYVNHRSSFRNEAELRGVQAQSAEHGTQTANALHLGVVFGDIDNDGDLDLYLCSLNNKNALFLNDGQGFFRDVSEQRGAAGEVNDRTNAAAFGDVDNDGNLDLFVTNEETSNRLFLNDGNGYFTDDTDAAGLRTTGGGMGVTFGDIDGDGDLDLYVANWSAPNTLYRNESTKEHGVRFINVTDEAGVGGDPFTKSNAAVFADIDNDADLDLFVTNRKTSNRLYRNDGTGKFTDITATAIGIDSMQSYGASFGDFDHDGYLDLYVANVGENVFYRNNGSGHFMRATEAFGAELGGYSTGTAVGDIDNDGDLDLYSANFLGASSMLFINKVNDKNSIMLQVRGTKSNRDAIGTKIWLYKAEHAHESAFLVGFREINGGSGYGSQNAGGAHFGVEKNQRYDVVLHFPASGVIRVLKNVRQGAFLVVEEEEGRTGANTLLAKSFTRFATEPETHWEVLKFGCVLAFLGASLVRGNKRYGWGGGIRTAFVGGGVLLYWSQLILFFHEKLFFSTILPLLSVVLFVVITHLVYDRFVLRRRAEEEQERTRERIARDLHDDLASTLGSTAMYAESLKQSLKNAKPETRRLAKKIGDLLLEAEDAMVDIVWSVTPHNDSLENLLARVRRLTSETCKAQGVHYTVQIHRGVTDILLPDEVRRNVYLIFKEALNNAMKHAYASSIQVTAGMNRDHLEFIIQDNGKGFEGGASPTPADDGEQEGSTHGHGLRNMARRASDIGAQLSVQSIPARGTRVSLSKKMT